MTEDTCFLCGEAIEAPELGMWVCIDAHNDCADRRTVEEDIRFVELAKWYGLIGRYDTERLDGLLAELETPAEGNR